MTCKLYFKNCEGLEEIKSRSIQLAIISPPFTNYLDKKTLIKSEYIDFIKNVIRDFYRVLKTNGVMVIINTDLRDHSRYNQGDKKFDGLIWHKHSALKSIAEDNNFLCFDTKIWAKTLKTDVYRYTFSYIQFFKKNKKILQPLFPKIASGFGPDIWLLENGTRRKHKGIKEFRDAIHPEIVERCINQYTKAGDYVLSPFTGSGTIPSVANLLRRNCIAYEIDKSLKPLILDCINYPQNYPAFLQLVDKI